jgi:hypothetical protein
MRLARTIGRLLAAALLVASCGRAEPPTSDIDTLVEECRGGDDLSCDILYVLSEPGSEEEDVAFECGGRGGQTFCTGYDRDSSTADSYGDDPLLDALTDLCDSGVGDACDGLTWAGPVGSAYRDRGVEESG